MRVVFELIESGQSRIEVMRVERLSLPRDFVTPGPTLMFIPGFTGRLRLAQFVESLLKPEPIFYFLPDACPVFFERITTATDVLFISLLEPSNFGKALPLEIKRSTEPGINHNLLTVIDDLFHHSAGNPSSTHIHEMLIDKISSIFELQNPLGKAKEPYRNAMQLFERLRIGLDFDVDIGEVCQELKVHISQASREFRRTFGLPPYRFWLLLRLARSRQGLIQQSSATEVAHKYGFADQSHFIRSFRRFHLRTPTQYQVEIKQR